MYTHARTHRYYISMHVAQVTHNWTPCSRCAYHLKKVFLLSPTIVQISIMMHCWIWVKSFSCWWPSLKLYFQVKMVFSFNPKCVRYLNFQDKKGSQKLFLHCHPHLSEAGESKMLLSGTGLENKLKPCKRYVHKSKSCEYWLYPYNLVCTNSISINTTHTTLWSMKYTCMSVRFQPLE